MKTLIRVMRGLCSTGMVAFGVVYAAAGYAQTAVQTVVQTAAPTPADAASADAPVHVVTYYEVVPADQAPAKGARPAQILADYVDGARQEPGALSFEVLHDVEKRNRYVMLEVWRDRADFQQHAQAQSSIELTKLMQPWLIGPVDQRVNIEWR
jgi:quinol monooxygenase YgiN